MRLVYQVNFTIQPNSNVQPAGRIRFKALMDNLVFVKLDKSPMLETISFRHAQIVPLEEDRQKMDPSAGVVEAVPPNPPLLTHVFVQ